MSGPLNDGIRVSNAVLPNLQKREREVAGLVRIVEEND
jgi:hypothetical protein